MIKLTPEKAWYKYLLVPSKSPKWMEDSKDISEELPISKRELFGLIILAHLQNHLHRDKNWLVGYDPSTSEPNDGFVSDGVSTINIEHKIIPQMSKQEVLEAILSTYKKYAKKGASYGSGRTLIIFPNRTTQGLIKVSDLRDVIKGDSPFDRVLLMHGVSLKDMNTISVIHVSEHYPNTGLAQVDLNLWTGEATVPHYGLT